MSWPFAVGIGKCISLGRAVCVTWRVAYGPFKRAKWEMDYTCSSKEKKKKRGTQALRNTTCFQDNLRSLDCVCMTDSKSPLFLWRRLLIYSNRALRFILHINLEVNLSWILRVDFSFNKQGLCIYKQPCCQSLKERDRKDACEMRTIQPSDHYIKCYGYNGKSYY